MGIGEAGEKLRRSTVQVRNGWGWSGTRHQDRVPRDRE